MAMASDVCGFCFNEPVFGFCENCNILLGVSCFSIHTKITLFTAHSVFPLDNTENEKYLKVPIEKDIHEQKCQKHETDPQSFYCGRHDATVCGRCILADHMNCKDEIVDLHTTKFDEQKANALLVTLNEIEGEINYLQVRVDRNAQLNDECRASSMDAIKELRKKIDLRLNQLQFEVEQSTEKKHKENMNSLVEVAQIYKDVSLRIQMRTKRIEELSKKKQERHLFVYSKKLAIEIDEIRTAIKQSSFKNHITQFSFKEHPTLENILQKTILEIGTLEEVCDGSEEIVDDIHDTVTGTPEHADESCAREITQRKNVAFGITLCKNSVDLSLETNPRCSTFGKLTGYQPPGKMTVVAQSDKRKFGKKYPPPVRITYEFLNGQQSDGKPYKEITAKIVDSVNGRNTCRMLKLAFQKKLLFTINGDGAIVYNGIDPPSPSFVWTPQDFAELFAQFEAKGITMADIDTNDNFAGTVIVD